MLTLRGLGLCFGLVFKHCLFGFRFVYFVLGLLIFVVVWDCVDVCVLLLTWVFGGCDCLCL